MKRTAEVVIIGGGIQGISLAYHLANKGLCDVLVVEMNALGSGSSSRSAAMIGYGLQSENCLRLTQIALGAIERFQDELGADPGYEPIGYLLLGGPLYASRLRQDHALHPAQQVPLPCIAIVHVLCTFSRGLPFPHIAEFEVSSGAKGSPCSSENQYPNFLVFGDLPGYRRQLVHQWLAERI